MSYNKGNIGDYVPAKPFDAELVGAFHTVRLYDKAGREVLDLKLAAEVAEGLYGSDWQGVFNGNEGMSRDDYLSNE